MKVKTAFKQIKTFFSDVFEFSFSVAIGRLVRDLPFIDWEKRRKFYEKRVSGYLHRHYKSVVEKCVNEFERNVTYPVKEKRIWVMWWQGEDNMPPIVKACYQQLIKVSADAGCSVTLITKDNYSIYADLPKYVIEKVKKGYISLTHFSDIVRFALLEKHGGAWMDATIYADELPGKMFESEFYTLRASGLFPNFISRGDWGTFLLCFNGSYSLLSECVLSILLKYWERHTRYIDYLFLDYIILMISDLIPSVNKLISSVEENRLYYELNLHINDKYDNECFRSMLKKSPLQKLTYKKSFALVTDEQEYTYYSFLIGKEVF